MNILILGDVVGPAGVKTVVEKLPGIIKEKKIDFVILNGENAADGGVGITEKNTLDFFKAGADVITSGNHIWDQKETAKFIMKEKRLLRPENSLQPSPGQGMGIFQSKNKKKNCSYKFNGQYFYEKKRRCFSSRKEIFRNN